MQATIVTNAILSLVVSCLRCAHRAQQHDNNDEQYLHLLPPV